MSAYDPKRTSSIIPHTVLEATRATSNYGLAGTLPGVEQMRRREFLGTLGGAAE